MTRAEIYALAYGAMRGLWELPTTIALAVYYSNWWLAPLGLLGCIGMPISYYAAGKLSKLHATRYAELAYGAVRGLILTGVLLCLH